MKTHVMRTNRGIKWEYVGIILTLLLLTSFARAVDVDGDFMEDQWEDQHGLDPGNADDALLDLDHDGFTNLCEYLHHSIPTDAGQTPTENVTIAVPVAIGTIQEAIDMTIDGDTVLVQPGTYEEGISLSDKEIRLTGTAPSDPDTVAATVIDPGDADCDVVCFGSGDRVSAVLEGVTVTGGRRGVYCSGRAAPVITHCIIENNASTGLNIDGFGGVEVTVSHCRITANAHGGLACSKNRLYLSHTVIANNIVTLNGDKWGTGVHLYSGDAGYTRIHNCTIVGHYEQGIRTLGISAELPDIVNCILWGNEDDLLNCFATFSCIQDGDAGQGNCDEDPCFVDIDANDFRISPGSLCIDGGVPWSDYSAEPVPNGSRINMGAYGNTARAGHSTDLDADGISDNWERHYWLADPPSVHDPNDDPDGDGFDNRTEYLYGYDPTVNTEEPLGIVYAQVLPLQFDPTRHETLSIHYWLNADATVAIGMAAESDPNDILQTMTHVGLNGENTLLWDGCDPNGDILEKGGYFAVVDANANYVLSQAQSNASELRYNHTVRELLCQPGRFLPLHNEITKITYDARPDADMAIEIYDPTGNLFCAHTIDAADPNEILWQGTDKGLGHPLGRYISQPGTYRIKAHFHGMREHQETVIEVYR